MQEEAPTPNPPNLSPRPFYPLLLLSNVIRFVAGWTFTLTSIWALWLFLPFLLLHPLWRIIGMPAAYYPETLGIRAWASLFLFLIGVHVQVEGSGRDPTVLLPNHLSALDSFIISAKSSHFSARYIMKKEMIYYCPPIFLLAKLFGSTTIDRKNTLDSKLRLNHAGALILSSGHSLVVFPEGTRTRTSKMLEFKKGAFHIALANKATITPVVLNGCWHLWPPGSLLPAPGTVKLAVLDPISSTGKSVDELLKESREMIIKYMKMDSFRVHDHGYFLGTLPSLVFLLLFYLPVYFYFF